MRQLFVAACDGRACVRMVRGWVVGVIKAVRETAWKKGDTGVGAAILALLLAGCGGLTFEPHDEVPAAVRAVDGAGDAATASAVSTASGEPERWRDDKVWPQRLAVRSGLGSWARGQVDPARPIMGTIVPVTGPVQAAGTSRPAQEKVERELYVDVQALMQRRTGRSVWRNYTVVGEGPGSYLFVTSDDPYASDVWDGPAGKPSAYFKFMSARPAAAAGAAGREVVFTDDQSAVTAKAGKRAGRDDEQRLIIERTWFVLYAPKPRDGTGNVNGVAEKPKGLIVLLPGMFGTPRPTVEQFVGELRAQNYAVLRALSHPSRFTEQVTFGVVESADLQPQAELVARTLTDRAAESAYAVQAALLHAKDTTPELRDVPVTLLGLSGGAMVAPTVVARSPGSFNSAVLIAGGADFLQVALESNYKDLVDALHFVWFPTKPARPEPAARPDGRTAPSFGMMRADDKPPAELLARFVELYHAAAPLDNVSTASALKGLRTLFILATGDKAVPYARGVQLWEAAGKPDRYLTSGGHELLFLFLPNSFGAIVKWIESGKEAARVEGGQGGGTGDSSDGGVVRIKP